MRLPVLTLAIAAALASSTTLAEAPTNSVPNFGPNSGSTANALSGIWVNPKGSVKVKTGECGAEVCGWIVWADEQAISDAREAGVDRLIGTVLLQDYHPVSTDHWQGRVYVPDMGGTYFSRMERLDADHLKISGCILGGWICKSQVWLKD